MKMTKTILSFLLAAVMLLALVPGMALAENPEPEPQPEHGNLGVSCETDLVVGATAQIDTNEYPYELTFASSNENILTVNAQGLVSAVAVGTAKVTVTDKEQPQYSVDLDITVVTGDTLMNNWKKDVVNELNKAVKDAQRSTQAKELKNGISRINALKYNTKLSADDNYQVLTNLVAEVYADADQVLLDTFKKEANDFLKSAKKKATSEKTLEAIENAQKDVEEWKIDNLELYNESIQSLKTMINTMIAEQYRVTSGANQRWRKDSGKTASFTIKGDEVNHKSFEHFSGVELNGETLERDTDYTVKEGSTIVTIKPAVLQRLRTGKYTLRILFDDDAVKTTIRISTGSSPATGDNSNPALWIAVMATALLGIGAIVVFSRKRRVTA